MVENPPRALVVGFGKHFDMMDRLLAKEGIDAVRVKGAKGLVTALRNENARPSLIITRLGVDWTPQDDRGSIVTVLSKLVRPRFSNVPIVVVEPTWSPSSLDIASSLEPEPEAVLEIGDISAIFGFEALARDAAATLKGTGSVSRDVRRVRKLQRSVREEAASSRTESANKQLARDYEEELLSLKNSMNVGRYNDIVLLALSPTPLIAVKRQLTFQNFKYLDLNEFRRMTVSSVVEYFARYCKVFLVADSVLDATRPLDPDFDALWNRADIEGWVQREEVCVAITGVTAANVEWATETSDACFGRTGALDDLASRIVHYASAFFAGKSQKWVDQNARDVLSAVNSGNSLDLGINGDVAGDK
jgi:hypothetical protein